MNLYVDLATRRIVFSPKLNKEIARVDVKRGDVFPLSIVFIRNGKPVQINASPMIEFCAKSKNNLEGLALVYANSFTLTNASTNPSYNGTVAFNSAGLATILNNVAAEEDDLQFIDLHSEISWIDGTQVYTTSNLVLRVYNDVIKGNEVTPTPQPNQPVIFLYGIETSTIEGIDGGSVTVNGTLNANHIHGNMAGTLYTHVRTGEAMYKGDPFYISSFHVGTSQPIVMRADASDASKMPAVGVMDADYANNTSGANGIISGTLSSINTNGYAVNSPIYVKDGGGYSNVAGTIRQQVGITERANTNTGAFIVTNSKVISSADITDATSENTANTVVKRSSTGYAEASTFAAIYPSNAQSGFLSVGNKDGAITYETIIKADVNTDGILRIPNLNSDEKTAVITGNADGSADSLTDGTIAGTTTFNSTSYTYGTGAAAAHREALNVVGKQSKTTTSAVTSTNASEVDVFTGLTDFTLEANATYRLTMHAIISTASGGSFEFFFDCASTTYLGGVSQTGAGVFRSGGVLNGGYHYNASRFSPLYATQNLTNGHAYGEYYFRTSSTAGTAKMKFAQRSSAIAGTTTVAAGATVILEKIS